MSTQKIGRYEVLQELGRGGMAMVYLARDPLFDRQVAIKVLSRYLLQDPSFRGRFEREAKVIAALEHDAIVPVYDFGEFEEQLFLVMRYMPGGTLHERIAGRPLPLPEVSRIVARVASGLDEAHNRGIIHRDLKPSNILFDAKDQPYLSDFGLAKLAETGASYTGTSIVGTPPYMSPEQARGASLDRRSDIYTLGVIAFEMLTGRLPYESDTPMGVAVMHIVEPVPMIRTVNPNLSQACEALIARALAKDPNERFQRAGEFARALGELPEVQAVAGAYHTPLPRAMPTAPTMFDLPSGTASRPSAAPAGTLPGAGGPVTPQTPAVARLTPMLIAAILGLAAIILGGGAFAAFRILGGLAKPSETSAPTQTIPAATATTAPTQPPTATATVAPTPTLPAGATQVSAVDGAVLVYIPAGAFDMGSEQGDLDERPVHRARLNAYWIDRAEVTNENYEKCVEARECREPARSSSSSQSSYYGNPSFARYPVIYVSWDDAKAYCEWAGRRLPTEAEWEKAARGADGRKYPWGNQEPTPQLNLMNYNARDTTAIGFFPDGASPYGVYDMAGNVYEWVADWYADDYYETAPVDNPAGPETGTYRVLRGGAWNTNEYAARASDRFRLEPGSEFSWIGFRCAMSP